ncbi:G-protein coupled receptor 54-like isoform X1 [Ostrea edulis]|uniref:G-protein coupled receptor 54-like isoform X1 n=1 Tax=Ostrea edulis TaxID=37623 RepID=UPI002094C694|nr:G-protein coupled receptor 54-like isoform X1 [Ostrea edulis]
MNNSTRTDDSMLNDYERLPLIVIWVIIIVVGVMGNITVIYIICRHAVKSATTIYILSLAIADIAFLTIVVPPTLLMFIGNFPVLIKYSNLVEFFSAVTVHVTCWTLMAMTIDRYHAVAYPIKSMRWRNTKTSSVISLGVWIVSAVLSVPRTILEYNTEWSSTVSLKVSGVILVLTTYGIPLLAIMTSYAKILYTLHTRNEATLKEQTKKTKSTHRTRKATKTVVVLILLFACSWGPVQVLVLWGDLDPNFPRTMPVLKFKLFAHTLSYANSCMNPFVYAFMNATVRKALVIKLNTMCHCVH